MLTSRPADELVMLILGRASQASASHADFPRSAKLWAVTVHTNSTLTWGASWYACSQMCFERQGNSIGKAIDTMVPHSKAPSFEEKAAGLSEVILGAAGVGHAAVPFYLWRRSSRRRWSVCFLVTFWSSSFISFRCSHRSTVKFIVLLLWLKLQCVLTTLYLT